MARSSRTSDLRSAPATCNAPSSNTARSARPVARNDDVVVGPATVALVQSPSSTIAYGHEIGARNASVSPTTTPTHAHGCAVEARGGCDRWSLGSQAHDVLARVHDADGAAGAVGELARRDAHRRCDLSAERAAVGERRHRVAARLAPRCVGLQVRGFDPRRAEPYAVGHRCRGRERRYRIDRRPSALHLARERACLEERLGDDPRLARGLHCGRSRSRREWHRDEARRAGAPSSAKPPSPKRYEGAHELRRAAFELRPTGRRRGITRPASA